MAGYRQTASVAVLVVDRQLHGKRREARHLHAGKDYYGGPC
jgi:hypothetical protein